MKVRFISALLSAAMLFCLLCSGCSIFSKYDLSSGNMAFYDPIELKISDNKSAQITQVGKHTYHFDVDIPADLCIDFIEAQEKLCAYIADNGLHTDEITFCVLNNCKNYSLSDCDIAYFGIDTLNTWEQILTTILAIKGDYTNYGYVYALADNIAAELEWLRDDPGKVIYSFDEKNLYLLNTVYPCFTEKYVTRYDVALCKSTVIDIMSGMTDIWSPAEFSVLRHRFANSLDLDFEPTYLTFAYGGENCPLKIATKYLNVYVDPTYYTEECYYVHDVKFNKVVFFDQILTHYETADKYISAVRDTFYFVDDRPIPVKMTANIPELLYPEENVLGLYVVQGDSGIIYAKAELALVHEYVHHITYHIIDEYDSEWMDWHIEALAYYYSAASEHEKYMVFYDKYPLSRANINKFIGQLYDTLSDYFLYIRCTVRDNEGNMAVDELQYDTFFLPAFGEYFVRTYGEAAFINSMLYPSMTEVFTGTTLDDILSDWYIDMLDPANDENFALPALNTPISDE